MSSRPGEHPSANGDGSGTKDRPDSEQNSSAGRFASFAVLDLETTNLPNENCGKVSITELSLYGFAASEAKNAASCTPPLVQELPRVLHKLTLLFNPLRAIFPCAEASTGLNNFQLEAESSFNEAAAAVVVGFLGHLQAPVCLVAHNGWEFDFPILKAALDKVNATLPATTLCVDSLAAFQEIDCQRAKVIAAPMTPPGSETIAGEEKAEKDAFKEKWRANETTPKRPTKVDVMPQRKRPQCRTKGDADEVPRKQSNRYAASTSAARELFPQAEDGAAEASGESPKAMAWKRATKRFIPGGLYKLGNIYKRTFDRLPGSAHRAEADVTTLATLILHNGPEFWSYATEYAAPFHEVRRVGAPWPHFK